MQDKQRAHLTQSTPTGVKLVPDDSCHIVLAFASKAQPKHCAVTVSKKASTEFQPTFDEPFCLSDFAPSAA